MFFNDETLVCIRVLTTWFFLGFFMLTITGPASARSCPPYCQAPPVNKCQEDTVDYQKYQQAVDGTLSTLKALLPYEDAEYKKMFISYEKWVKAHRNDCPLPTKGSEEWRDAFSKKFKQDATRM